MKNITVNNQNIQDYFEELVSEIEKHGSVVCGSQPASVGKWTMARLWRGWMSTTADYMAKNGVTMPLMVSAEGVAYAKRPFNADDAHELFTRQHMCVDESGQRLSWSKSIKKEQEGKERVATKGERFNALRLHEEWCSSRGITLFKPRDGEYKDLSEKQEE